MISSFFKSSRGCLNVYGILGQGNLGGTRAVNTATLTNLGTNPTSVTVNSDGTSVAQNSLDASNAHATAYSATSVANPQKVATAVGTNGVPTAYLSNISQIAAGYDHMVALDKEGRVWTWGRNNFGQLGYDTGAVSYSALARKVTIQENGEDVDIMAVAAGEYHTLALTNGGEVWAWGYNHYGQLGRETLPTKWADFNSTPVKVLGDRGEGHIGNVVMISAGGDTSAALKGDGTVWTWGRNDFGQMGIGTNEKPIGAPTQVLKGNAQTEGNYLTGISDRKSTRLNSSH